MGGPTPFVMTTDMCIIEIGSHRSALEAGNVYLYME